MNLASKSTEERRAIEADKHACLIRSRCKHLWGRDRQLCAVRLLNKIPEEHHDSVMAAMKRRAGK